MNLSTVVIVVDDATALMSRNGTNSSIKRTLLSGVDGQRGVMGAGLAQWVRGCSDERMKIHSRTQCSTDHVTRARDNNRTAC